MLCVNDVEFWCLSNGFDHLTACEWYDACVCDAMFMCICVDVQVHLC